MLVGSGSESTNRHFLHNEVHEVRIQDSNFIDSFQVAVIHQIELNGTERH